MDSYDDDIELLKQTPEESNIEETAGQLDSGLNTLYVVKRAKYSDETIDRGPILALQTAFTTLQRKHNEEVRKNKTLLRENHSMKKALMDATQGNQPHYENLDRGEFMLDTEVAHAAGGTSEDESLAENRAKLGLVHHLQRELLVTRNAEQLGNEEISKLKKSVETYEIRLKNLCSNNEALVIENEDLKDRLQKKDDEISRLNSEIARMKNALQSEQEQNHNMKLKLEVSQEQISVLQKTGYSSQSENQNLKLRIAQLETESRKLYSAAQFRELESKLKETLESKGVLEAKCKQLEIENNIRSQQRQQQGEDSDDVDGDIAALQKALYIIDTEKEEVKAFKEKIKAQNVIISQLQKSGKLNIAKSLDTFSRPEAQGASFNVFHERALNENHSDLQTNTQTGHSQKSSRRSDKGDYRSQYSGQEQKTSPRVEDDIRPTGQLTPMLAMESNMLPKRMEPAGNFAAASTISPNRNRSPGENIGDSKLSNYNGMKGHENNMFSRTSVSGNQPIVAQQNARRSSSPRTGNGREPYGSAIVESPPISYAANVTYNKALLQSNMQDTAYVHAGARPRVPATSTGINYFNQFDSQSTNPVMDPQQKIPDRMSQSEIIVKNRSGSDNNLMTRSVFEPVKPLEISKSANNLRHSEFTHDETSRIGKNLQNFDEHTYQNDYREHYDNGPDYENIYNANAQTETKRPIEEHEETVFTTAKESGFNIITNPVQEETGDVNVVGVKICPVCNEECSRLTQDQFQMHVVECFDNNDESPATLQPAASGKPHEDDRTCPMCDAVFPLTIPQETYEQHVLAHFGDDPQLGRFEMLQ